MVKIDIALHAFKTKSQVLVSTIIIEIRDPDMKTKDLVTKWTHCMKAFFEGSFSEELHAHLEEWGVRGTPFMKFPSELEEVDD